MKKAFFALLAIFIIVGFIGCSTPARETQVTQGDQKSYIFFSGNVKEAIAYIDGKPFLLTEDSISSAASGQSNNAQVMSTTKIGRNLIQIAPGKHEVKVIKNNQILVHRIILVGEGTAFELPIP